MGLQKKHRDVFSPCRTLVDWLNLSICHIVSSILQHFAMSTEAQDRSNILNINVGVLGHVDAGKTALVRYFCHQHSCVRYVLSVHNHNSNLILSGSVFVHLLVHRRTGQEPSVPAERNHPRPGILSFYSPDASAPVERSQHRCIR